MKGKKFWRLSKTLSRRIEVRPIEQSDVKYAWAAYKTGRFTQFSEGLDAAKFKAAFESLVLTTCPATWVVIADSKNGFIPSGFAFGSWAPLGAYLIILDIVWCLWASNRTRLEGTVAFFNRIRKETPVMGYARPEHKPVYEVCCMHGIMRRVGTSHVVFPDGPAAVFEGKK